MIIEHVWNLSFDTCTNIVDIYVNYPKNGQLQLQDQQNTVAGAGMTAVVGQLVHAENVLNATLAAVGKTSQLSLFDFLK